MLVKPMIKIRDEDKNDKTELPLIGNVSGEAFESKTCDICGKMQTNHCYYTFIPRSKRSIELPTDEFIKVCG